MGVYLNSLNLKFDVLVFTETLCALRRDIILANFAEYTHKGRRGIFSSNERRLEGCLQTTI